MMNIDQNNVMLYYIMCLVFLRLLLYIFLYINDYIPDYSKCDYASHISGDLDFCIEFIKK
jgi:hypothetical protein